MQLDRRRFLAVAGAVSGAALAAAPLGAAMTTPARVAVRRLRAESLTCVAIDWPVEPRDADDSNVELQRRATALADSVDLLLAQVSVADLLLLPVLPDLVVGDAARWLAPLRQAALRTGTGILLASTDASGAALIETDGARRQLPPCTCADVHTPNKLLASEFGNWVYLTKSPDATQQRALSAAGVECVVLPPRAELPAAISAPLAFLTTYQGAPPLPPGCPDIWAGRQSLTCGVELTGRSQSREVLPIGALRRLRLAA